MKKLLIIFTIAGSIYTTTSFAQEKTPQPVSQSFHAHFNDVQQASWSEVGNLYKATFTLMGQSVSAFFNAAGELIASTKDVTVLQLPVPLQTSLQGHYKDFAVSDLFEVDNEAGTAYYITLHNETQNIQLKSTAYGEWKVYQKG